MNITTREALEIAMSWLVPGFILSTVFRLFVPFLRWERSEAVLGYLAIGSLFATLRLLGVPVILTALVLPALVGTLLGVVTNRYRERVYHFLPLTTDCLGCGFLDAKRSLLSGDRAERRNGHSRHLRSQLTRFL